MSGPSLAVIISTIEENLNSFITNFSFKNLKNADEVIIVIQGLKGKSVIPELSSYKVINDENYGLSSSRNIGIKNSSCDFIWFLDDDVVLIDDCIDKLKSHLEINYSFDLHTVRMQFLDGKPYKNYSNKKKLGRINSLRVSSVELVASRSFINSNHIRFNKNLGLGSKFPSTEENFFYLDIFDNGGLVTHLPEFLLKHEYIDRKAMHFKNKFILNAKGMFCRRYGGITGLLILIYYFLKCFFISRSMLLSFSLIEGYKEIKKNIET